MSSSAEKRITRTQKFCKMLDEIDVTDAQLLRMLKTEDIDRDMIVPPGTPMLVLAAGNGRGPVVRTLLAEGAQVNCRDMECNTPLIAAAMVGSSDTVRSLLAAGADLTLYNNDGNTASHAVMCESAIIHITDALGVLLAASGDVEMPDRDGWTLLMQAARNGNTGQIDILLAAGANIEARANEKVTPLMCALYGDNEDNINMLLQRGANIYAYYGDRNAPVDSLYNIKPYATCEDDADKMKDHPFIVDAQRLYRDFAAHATPPASTADTYKLLAATPLANPQVPVDYAGNLRRIFTQAKWTNITRAQNILREMQSHGMVSADTAASIMGATFGRGRVRQPQSAGRAV